MVNMFIEWRISAIKTNIYVTAVEVKTDVESLKKITLVSI